MPELIIILVIALIIFGPRKLPELGKSLGRSLNEFKKASTDLQNTLEQEIKIEEQKEQHEEQGRREVRVDPAFDSGRRPVRYDSDRRRPERHGAAARDAFRRSYLARGTRSFPKSEPSRRRAETCRRSRAGSRRSASRRRAGRRRPDDVPRASRRAAQAHHARRRRAARRLHHRVRLHQPGLRFRLSAAGRRRARRQADLHRSARDVHAVDQDRRAHRRPDRLAVHHVAGVAVHRAGPVRERKEARDSVRALVVGALHRRRRVLALLRVPGGVEFLRGLQQLLHRVPAARRVRSSACT